MTQQIERCLCGGECSVDGYPYFTWMECGHCDYESTAFAAPSEAITAHNRMMRAARQLEVAIGIESMDIPTLQAFAVELAQRVQAAEVQASMAHQQLLDERGRWEEERKLLTADPAIAGRIEVVRMALDSAKVIVTCHVATMTMGAENKRLQVELDTMITAHKQQIADLIDALVPVEWEVGRVPTEPGWYAYCPDEESAHLPPDILRIGVYEPGKLHVFHAWWRPLDKFTGRWLGPVALPQKRKVAS